MTTLAWSIATGAPLGIAFGYLSQRGAFCLSSGLRFVITKRDTTKLKAYLVAVAVQAVLVTLWAHLGPAGGTSYPPFYPLGVVFGGVLFGVAMRWAGGCAAGVWYKSGTGDVGAAVAVVGMAAGALLVERGTFEGVRRVVHSVVWNAPTDWGWLSQATWAAVPLGLVLLVRLLRAPPAVAGAWSFQRTGLALGVLGSLVWPLSYYSAGRPFGMAVVPGSVGLLSALVSGFSASSATVAGATTWDLAFVLAIPLGGFLAARQAGPVKLTGAPRKRLLQHLTGGVALGIGASFAVGCTVGHGLTAVPLLSPASILAMFAIFAGVALDNKAATARRG